MPELGRQGPAIFKTPDARTAFHSASRREQRDTLRRRLREDLGRYFSASSSSPKRLEANSEMYISHESRHITLVDKAMSDCPQIVTRTGEGGWVVVVSIEEWMRVERRNGNLVEFFLNSPLREEGLHIERQRDYPRDRLSSRHECHL